MVFPVAYPFYPPKVLPSGTVEKWLAGHPSGQWFTLKRNVPEEITKSVEYNDKVMAIPCGSAHNVAGLVCIRYDQKEEIKGTPYNIDSWMLYGGTPDGDILFRLKKEAMGALHKARSEVEALNNALILLKKYGVNAWK